MFYVKSKSQRTFSSIPHDDRNNCVDNRVEFPFRSVRIVAAPYGALKMRTHAQEWNIVLGRYVCAHVNRIRVAPARVCIFNDDFDGRKGDVARPLCRRRRYKPLETLPAFPLSLAARYSRATRYSRSAEFTFQHLAQSKMRRSRCEPSRLDVENADLASTGLSAQNCP